MTYQKLIEKGLAFTMSIFAFPFAVLGWLVNAMEVCACRISGHWWRHTEASGDIDWECHWCGKLKEGNWN